MPDLPYAITISDDDMEAWLCFSTDASIPLVQLDTAIAAAGIVHGVDQFLLQDLAAAHQAGYDYRIAQGTPPKDGLEYFFTRHRARAPRRLANGQVDFYNLDTVQNVVQHQILVAQRAPDGRTPGRTVTGKAIPPRDQVFPLPRAGPNVAVSADGTALMALINGYPVLSEEHLRVDPCYTLQGDVDLAVGHLTCIGDLVVAGDVKYGFHVRCARNISVHGIVDGGSIEAGGSVYLYGNVLGQQKSYIRSAGSISGTYVDAATVESQQDITLTRGVRRSHLRAGRSVMMQGDHSNILGGTVQAFERILAYDIGSAREVPTRVEILPGLFDAAIQERFIAHLATLLAEDQRQLTNAETFPVGPDALTALHTLLQRCRDSLPQFVEYFQIRHGIFPPLPRYTGTVIVLGTVYPGVTICIGNVSYTLPQPMTRVQFYHTDGRIQGQSLDIVEMDAVGAA
jgi:uncharacterized protein